MSAAVAEGIKERLSIIVPREDLVNIGLSMSFWATVYVILNYLPPLFKPKACVLSKKNELDVKNRMVSFVHGFTVMLLSAREFYFTPGSCGDANTPFEKLTLYILCGYFTYDFLAMAYYGLLDMAMTIHHSICIFGIMGAFSINTTANYAVIGTYLGEVSNTFMHVRVILKHYGLRYTKAYETMEIMFIMLYIYARILVGPAVVWSTVSCSHNHIIARFSSLGLLGQSLFYFMQMVSILRKRFKEISMRKLHRVKSRWFDPLTPSELEKLGVSNKKDEKHIL